MKNIALFPGTFDPITIGHVNVIERAMPLFDEIIIGIGHNSNKVTLFKWEQRLEWIQDIFKDNQKVRAEMYEGLTADFCKKINANFILRGIRNMADFDYEKTIAQMNKLITLRVETVFFMSDPSFSPVSSSVVRDLIRNGGDATPFLPKEVKYTSV